MASIAGVMFSVQHNTPDSICNELLKQSFRKEMRFMMKDEENYKNWSKENETNDDEDDLQEDTININGKEDSIKDDNQGELNTNIDERGSDTNIVSDDNTNKDNITDNTTVNNQSDEFKSCDDANTNISVNIQRENNVSFQNELNKVQKTIPLKGIETESFRRSNDYSHLRRPVTEYGRRLTIGEAEKMTGRVSHGSPRLNQSLNIDLFTRSNPSQKYRLPPIEYRKPFASVESRATYSLRRNNRNIPQIHFQTTSNHMNLIKLIESNSRPPIRISLPKPVSRVDPNSHLLVLPTRPATANITSTAHRSKCVSGDEFFIDMSQFTSSAYLSPNYVHKKVAKNPLNI